MRSLSSSRVLQRWSVTSVEAQMAMESQVSQTRILVCHRMCSRRNIES